MKIQAGTLQLYSNSNRTSNSGGNNQFKKAIDQVLDLTNRGVKINGSQNYFGLTPGLNPIFQFKERFRTEDVFAQKDIYETRAKFEDKPIFEARLEGSRNLFEYTSLNGAGINRKSRFFVNVGEGPRAQIKFDNSNRISVKINSVSERFRFGADDGSFRTALVDALNSIDGLVAEFTDSGKLNLKTTDANALILSRPRKLERSAHTALGLQTGTINPELVGYNKVNVGDEKILVGTETVKVGSQQVFESLDRHIVGLTGANTRSVGNFRSAGLTSLETVKILFSQNSSATIAQVNSAYNTF